MVTCQAQLTLKRRLIARQGEPEPDNTHMIDQYEKFNTFLVPAIYKSDHLRSRSNEKQNSYITPPRFIHPTPTLHTRLLIDESDENEDARLAEIDKEALSKISEEDRKIIENTLSLAEREALLIQLENGQLDGTFPRDENRFGGLGLNELIFGGMTGGVVDAGAQLGATAGRYIGSKLAGTLGAKLGAAAGAYLGAAAATRLFKKSAKKALG